MSTTTIATDTPKKAAPAPYVNAEMTDAERVLHSRDIFEVATYLSTHPGGKLAPDLQKVYQELRAEWLNEMKANPSKYNSEVVRQLIDDGIFTQEILKEAGLMTDESWNAMQLEREYLPDMADFQRDTNEPTGAPRGVDVYFFGMPSSGKTSMLMGIAAANGQGFTLDMRSNGGPYAAALRQYAQVGLIPGRTYGQFVTTVGGNVLESNSRGRARVHPINLVEMSGDEFALRIAETKEPSLANMGTGATNLMRNDNRKIMFIVVDAANPKVKLSYLDHEIGEIDDLPERVYVHKRYLSQLDILDKFVVLLGLPENQEIMNKVDAIHFIVTKADELGPEEERDEKAQELINTKYLSVVEQLRFYCRNSKHINHTFDYEPQIYTFSLGKFYLGDVFEYNNTDALKVVDAIRESAHGGIRSWWDKVKCTFRLV